jgi:glyceraldehyde 3-phosphate dehydrogenase
MRIAINGFGRIGRNILRSYLAREQVWKKFNQIEIVAINDLGSPSDNAHLLKYDSVHGKLKNEVEYSETSIKVDGFDIACFSEKDPAKLPWAKLNIDIVFECTGLFTSKDKAEQHIQAGAKRVLISAPGQNVDKTIVFGVNHETLTNEDRIISNASCTTNCLAPLAKIIHEEYKILNGLVNTIHAYTNDQSLLDVHHSDLLRARAASLSMIPTKTGAASAVGEVLPELSGKLDGLAVRVPVSNVSLLDFTFTTEKDFSIEELNARLEAAAKNGLSGILDVNEIPLVSTDFGNDSHSVIFDKSHTRKIGKTTKILAWYDNEWGFSNRMLDVANYLNQISKKSSQAA